MYTSTETLYSIFNSHSRICTDSRNPLEGSIFFALSGPSFNGNAYAESALLGGCAFAVIDQESFKKDDRYILVENTLKSLQDLALMHRRHLKAKFIGVTGSNGKTTTKELIREVLSRKYKTVATVGNLNNHIGVPLTILGIPEDTEMAVIEMGANKQGDIKELVDIAEPDFGLITNIGKAHLEGMGGVEGIIKTKTELYDFLRKQAKTVFVNTNHAVFIEKSSGLRQFTFGSGEHNDICGTCISSDPCVKFSWYKKGEPTQLNTWETSLMGRYNFENLLAAVSIGVYFRVSDADIHDAVSNYIPDNNRSQLLETTRNKLILDAYNANPTSMEAAIRNFADMQAQHKVVILGKMMELGETSLEEHIKIAALATQSSFERVFLIGEPYAQSEVAGAERIFENVDDAIHWFQTNPIDQSTILIKGSRANKLEKLTDVFR